MAWITEQDDNSYLFECEDQTEWEFASAGSFETAVGDYLATIPMPYKLIVLAPNKQEGFQCIVPSIDKIKKQ